MTQDHDPKPEDQSFVLGGHMIEGKKWLTNCSLTTHTHAWHVYTYTNTKKKKSIIKHFSWMRCRARRDGSVVYSTCVSPRGPMQESQLSHVPAPGDLMSSDLYRHQTHTYARKTLTHKNKWILVVVVVIFQDKVSLYGPGYPGICSVD